MTSGCILTYYWLADPNRSEDPQAENNGFCIRDEIGRVLMPQGTEWVAVAYNVNCDFIGNFDAKYIYLLRPGQIRSRSTLVMSYVGDDPMLEWQSDNSLIVTANQVDLVFRQTSELIGVKVSYRLSFRHQS